MGIEERQAAVTVSSLESFDDILEGHTCFQRYVYVECSYCEMLDHLFRVSVNYEKDKEGKVVFSTVDFQFPDECYIDPVWRKVKRNRVARFFQGTAAFLRRVQLSLAVLLGKPVHLCVSSDMNLKTAKDMAQKLIQTIEEAERP